MKKLKSIHRTHVIGRTGVRVQLSVLVNEALDRAVTFAARRAFKHRDLPIATPEELLGAIAESLPHEFWHALDDLGVSFEW